jgi:hypothetical protein
MEFPKERLFAGSGEFDEEKVRQSTTFPRGFILAEASAHL